MPKTSPSPDTISLIGMPGAGKSTVGVLLAKLCRLRFVDTDLDIQLRAGATLQDILEERGYRALRALEQKVLLEVDLMRAVISTGGSVVYSEAAMARLAGAGPLVYLQVDLPTLEQRIAAAPLRGIASSSAQSFADVYAERTLLYRRYASQVVDATASTPDEIVASIVRSLAPKP